MKKIISMLLVILMVVALAACSNSSTDKNAVPSDNPSEDGSAPSDNSPEKDDKPEDSKNVTVNPEDIEAAIAKALGDGYLCTVDAAADELFSTAMAGIDLSQVESYVVKQAAITAVYMDTVVVMKCKKGYADTAIDIINENYARTISYIRQYPFGVAKVEGARLYKVDDIVMLIIAGDYAPSDATAEEEARLAVSEYEKIDSAVKELFGSVPKNLAVITEPEDTAEEDDFGFDGGALIDPDFDMPMIGG